MNQTEFQMGAVVGSILHLEQLGPSYLKHLSHKEIRMILEVFDSAASIGMYIDVAMQRTETGLKLLSDIMDVKGKLKYPTLPDNELREKLISLHYDRQQEG